jgi:hypothetical protein
MVGGPDQGDYFLTQSFLNMFPISRLGFRDRNELSRVTVDVSSGEVMFVSNFTQSVPITARFMQVWASELLRFVRTFTRTEIHAGSETR